MTIANEQYLVSILRYVGPCIFNGIGIDVIDHGSGSGRRDHYQENLKEPITFHVCLYPQIELEYGIIQSSPYVSRSRNTIFMVERENNHWLANSLARNRFGVSKAAQ